MNNTIQIYVNVREDGTIEAAQTGKYVIPAEAWHYYFLKDEETAETIYDHRVVITNMKPELVLKDAV